MSSLDAVAFIEVVGEAFNITVPPEEVANFASRQTWSVTWIPTPGEAAFACRRHKSE